MLNSTSIGHLRNRSWSGWLCARGVNSGSQMERISRFTCTSPRGKTGAIGSTLSFSILSGSCDLTLSRCASAEIFCPFHRELTTVKYREPLLKPCSSSAFVPMFMIGGKCACFRAKMVKISGHLPTVALRVLVCLRAPRQGSSLSTSATAFTRLSGRKPDVARDEEAASRRFP
jgi:hypothetical protein